jgi:hypothetical protein
MPYSGRAAAAAVDSHQRPLGFPAGLTRLTRLPDAARRHAGGNGYP